MRDGWPQPHATVAVWIDTDPALRRKLAGYRAAVAALQPGDRVRAAFVSGQGAVVELG